MGRSAHDSKLRQFVCDICSEKVPSSSSALCIPFSTLPCTCPALFLSSNFSNRLVILARFLTCNSVSSSPNAMRQDLPLQLDCHARAWLWTLLPRHAARSLHPAWPTRSQRVTCPYLARGKIHTGPLLRKAGPEDSTNTRARTRMFSRTHSGGNPKVPPFGLSPLFYKAPPR